MLSAALKNLSEEDSAGSDAESVQSLEPETDRFGFLVTSRSTAGWGKSDCYCATSRLVCLYILLPSVVTYLKKKVLMFSVFVSSGTRLSRIQWCHIQTILSTAICAFSPHGEHPHLLPWGRRTAAVWFSCFLSWLSSCCLCLKWQLCKVQTCLRSVTQDDFSSVEMWVRLPSWSGSGRLNGSTSWAGGTTFCWRRLVRFVVGSRALEDCTCKMH